MNNAMRVLKVSLAAILVFSLVVTVQAHAPSGAIFTTLHDGTEVNLNHFPSKEAVYLDGGPGPGAPKNAAGLDNGVYVFQVTDPSGKVLLSTDPAKCRRFTVSGGVITGVVPTGGCEHLTGFDVDHGATTVQLFPFNDTPNPGGVYKVWATRENDFPAACLETVDCAEQGTKHGFQPSHSKTDNFKVQGDSVREIDVQFYADLDADGYRDWDQGEDSIPHLKMEWIDTLGVKNVRYSDPNFQFGVFAHVEVPETENGAVHTVIISDQRGCKVNGIRVNGRPTLERAGTLNINVMENTDYILEVACVTKGR